MDYLTGKDYPYLCKGCQGTIDAMLILIHAGAPDTYAGDPEGPIMMAGDKGLLRECAVCNPDIPGSNDPPEDKVGYDHPRWTVFMVWHEWSTKRVYALPICTAFDVWPIKSDDATFECIANQLGWDLVLSHAPRFNGYYGIGGFYVHPEKDISLECHMFGKWPEPPEGWTILSVVPKLDPGRVLEGYK